MAVKLIVVGVSLGGLNAVKTLISGLPREFPVPMAIVQHRVADADTRLASILRRNALLPVEEPQDKEPIAAGHIYLAPADYHLLVEGAVFALTTDRPVSYARPSIDVLFETAAESCGSALIGVVLTGANRDGAAGAARIKARGGLLIVQSPETAECPVMPRAALSEAPADYVVPLEQVAPLLIRLCSALDPAAGGAAPGGEGLQVRNGVRD